MLYRMLRALIHVYCGEVLVFIHAAYVVFGRVLTKGGASCPLGSELRPTRAGPHRADTKKERKETVQTHDTF